MRRTMAVIAVFTLLAAACTGAGGTGSGETAASAGGDASSVAREPEPAATQGSPATTAGSTDPGRCPSVPAVRSVDWQSATTATPTRLIEGPITVDAVVYPHPDYDGRPWSQWGQGIVLEDGRLISAIGDHRGPDGNSYVYVYDPATATLTQIADVLSLADHEPGAWGYGKVHAQMVEGPCGEILVTTYWGTRRDLTFSDTYQGDLLLRIDPANRRIENLGVFYSQHGVPSLATAPDLGLIYGEAVDPLAPPGGGGSFVVYDAGTGQVLLSDDRSDHSGFRSIAVAGDGRAFFSLDGGGLAVYDPAANAVTDVGATLPGEVLRAVAAPAADGTIFGVTDKPAVFFALDPDGSIRTLGDAAGYTTSIARTPDASTLYYIPDAHGGAWRQGTPLIAVDTATGTQQTLLELNAAAEERLGLRLGGTYSITADASGKTLYIGMNAGLPEGDREAFGEVVLLVVNLP